MNSIPNSTKKTSFKDSQKYTYLCSSWWYSSSNESASSRVHTNKFKIPCWLSWFW